MYIFDILTFIISLFVMFFESVILKFINNNIVLPDFLLEIVLFYSIYSKSIKGQIMGFSLGMVKDFLSSSPLGFYTIIYLTIGFLSSRFQNQNNQNYFILILISFFLFLVKAIFITIYYAVVKDISFISHFITSKFSFELILSLALSPIVFLSFEFILSKLISKQNKKY